MRNQWLELVQEDGIFSQVGGWVRGQGGGCRKKTSRPPKNRNPRSPWDARKAERGGGEGPKGSVSKEDQTGTCGAVRFSWCDHSFLCWTLERKLLCQKKEVLILGTFSTTFHPTRWASCCSSSRCFKCFSRTVSMRIRLVLGALIVKRPRRRTPNNGSRSLPLVGFCRSL